MAKLTCLVGSGRTIQFSLIQFWLEFGWLKELLPEILKVVNRLNGDFKNTVLKFNKRNLA
jgi:hypothetical protein